MLIFNTVSEKTQLNRTGKIEYLLSELSNGNISAMDELYSLIKTDVYAYALSKTASKADAEDITHDTFVKIWKNAKLYTPMGKPLAWIFTVEINIIRRYFTVQKKTVFLDELINEESDESFENDLVNKEFLSEMLLILNEEEREIISLHIVSGMKHREIANLLDKPLSTVISKYNRAINKLRDIIKRREDS